MATNLPVKKLLNLTDSTVKENSDTESIELNLREKTGKQVLWWILEVKGTNASYMDMSSGEILSWSLLKLSTQLKKEGMTADKTCMVCQ